MKNSLTVFFLTFLPVLAFSQDSSTYVLNYEVNKVLPYISVDTEQLKNAKSLIDLDKNYKFSWIKEYISVEILTINQGELKKATSENDTLSEEQKKNMESADFGTEIKVNVRYLP